MGVQEHRFSINCNVLDEKNAPTGALVYLGEATFRRAGLLGNSVAGDDALPPRLVLWAHISPQVLSAELDGPSHARPLRTPFQTRLEDVVLWIGADGGLQRKYDIQWSSGLGHLALLVPPEDAQEEQNSSPPRSRVMACLLPDEASRPHLADVAPGYERHRYEGIRLAYSVRRIKDIAEMFVLRDALFDIKLSEVPMARVISIIRGAHNSVGQIQHGWKKVQRHWKEVEMIRKHVDHVGQLQKDSGNSRRVKDSLHVTQSGDVEDDGGSNFEDEQKRRSDRVRENVTRWLLEITVNDY